jgi:peptidoglycan/xylan/chitin deacetylase (PgdA/CDA1 family)
MDHLFDYSPINSRAPITFPDGKTLAFYIGVNIETYRQDAPISGGMGIVPDPMAWGWREYGMRVGIWRMFDLFDELQLRASAIVNSEVCLRCPAVVEAAAQRDWAWVAHGRNNSILQTAMTLEEEQGALGQMMSTLDDCLPRRPKGWLGPGLSETLNTPKLLADYGFTYLLDWCCDDQPFRLKVPSMVSVPYSLDVNDLALFLDYTMPGPDYERIVRDHFEVLLQDSESIPRVMALPLHTFVVGQPHRFKYLSRVLREIASEDKVWLCTSDDIADNFLAASAD